MTAWEKFQQLIWRMIYPIFPYLQMPLAPLHGGRQRYHLGWLAPGQTLPGLKTHLQKQGFGNHFVAWFDNGQVLSWRKFDGFEWQYHLRVFNDGEIRGHYERTPEAAPIRHFSEDGESARKEEMLAFLGNFVTQKKYITYLEPDPSSKDITSEVTFAENRGKQYPTELPRYL